MNSHAGMSDTTIVVGGGLAGMTAAATLADAGHRVTLLESTHHLGGRARSRHCRGFDLNIGPHAMYLAGEAVPILRRLGVPVRGRKPRLQRAGLLVGGEVVPATRYLRSAVRGRVATLRAARGVGQRRAAALTGGTTEQWLEQTLDDPAGRRVVASFLRTANYAADFSITDAGAATRQLRLGSKGVLYLHGGWQSLVDGLAGALSARGVDVRLGQPVAAIRHDEQVRSVLLGDGTEHAASHVVLAINDPLRAAALLEGPGSARVGAAAQTTVPIRMAHLDVALRPLPEPRHPNVFGIDQPVYLAVSSDVANVAPAGSAVLSVGRYLTPGEEGTDHRAELEAVLDTAQPGWSDHAVDVRYTPRSLVAGDHARVATRGLTGRADVDVAKIRGLAIAGDWIGPRGALADAAVRSGRDAALLVASLATGAPGAAFVASGVG